MNVIELVQGIAEPIIIAMAFLLYIIMGVVQEWTDVQRYLKTGALLGSIAVSCLYLWPSTPQEWVQGVINGAVVFFLGWGSSFISNYFGQRNVASRTVSVPRDVAGGALVTASGIDDRRRWWSRW